MSFYDASKDTAVVKLAKQLPEREVTTAEIMEVFENAEPERQLCIICLLELSTPGEPLTELKRDAVNRLLAKVESPLTV